MSKGLSFLIVACAALLASCSDSDPQMDASSIAGDAMVDDAGLVRGCTSNTECSDGLFCTGIETCETGVCMPGTPMTCDDGIGCTIDVCSNQREECTSDAPDQDGDGHGDATCLDVNSLPLGDDCDDSDATRFPGNVEMCDESHVDEDCDESTFGALDFDGDGFLSASCCNPQAAGGLLCGNDCDDLRDNVRPGVSEACDGLDNNCDGVADEGVGLSGFADLDGDGFGDTNAPLTACAGSVGFANNSDDCDDADQSRYPGQAEICDGLDNDCDMDVDEDAVSVDWFVDSDQDGYGNAEVATIESCAPIVGRVIVGTDCDDSNAAIHPAAAELCDGLDNDCNGRPDFKIGVNDFEDDDEDGIVDLACTPLGEDCDDNNPNSGPAGVEQCDGQDNDCDSVIDENADQSVWYRDLDSDGYGSVVSGSVVSCQSPAGYSRVGGDCNDDDTSRSPGSDDLCNGQDDDCDSAVDEAPALSLCPAAANASSTCTESGCSFTCLGGFGDCDGDPVNGCEVDLNADASNCGSCDQTCTGSNQNGVCSSGSCSCSDGFTDCNGIAADGCEININSSLSHCGGCYNDCTFENAINQCISGSCQVAICVPGWGDCDSGVGGDIGCESRVDSLTNCASCGNDCTTLPSVDTTICNPNDGCEVGSCLPGYGDCNALGDDGCEADFFGDSQHCGSCFNQCFSLPGTTGTCIASTCECQVDFNDCDFQPGCESNSQFDSQNCGGCGNDCYATAINSNNFCDSGVCQSQCNGGWGSCGADPSQCNTDFTDINSCGGCGTVCSATNGTPTCYFDGIDSQCETSCDVGWQNCDADPTTCEAQTVNDPQNCGGCGNDCGAGGVCSDNGGYGSCDYVADVALGEDFTCALRDGGAVVCWGANDQGQLGNGTSGGSNYQPQAVPSLPPIIAISAGGKSACARSATEVYCWGENTRGQVGDGTSGGPATSPRLVAGLTAIDLAVGSNHVCALDVSNQVWCWGDDLAGQLGDGTSGGFVSSPQMIPANTFTETVLSVSAGALFSCASTNYSEVYCWGDNTAGQLGDSTFAGADRATPTKIPSYVGVGQEINSGTRHTCIIRNGNSTECWGGDDSFQLGNGAPAVDSFTPVAVSLVNAQRVHSAGLHTCALMNNSQIYCWGANGKGELGQGFAGANEASPVFVKGGNGTDPLSNIRSLFQGGTGAGHTCALDYSGFVHCWGDNASGQLGIDPGIDVSASLPTVVLGL